MMKLVVSVLLFVVNHSVATTTNAPAMSDPDVCKNSGTASFYTPDMCQKLTNTERCRLGIVNLLFAAANGALDSLKKYKDSGMNMSLVDYDRRAALHLAAAEGHMNCVEYLLKVAMVPSKPKDRWGNTPLDEAERFGKQDVVDYLKKYYAAEGSKSHSKSQ